MISTNQVVKFINPGAGEDPNGTYIVIENNGDRCIIQATQESMSTWPANLLPQFLVKTNELTAAE